MSDGKQAKIEAELHAALDDITALMVCPDFATCQKPEKGHLDHCEPHFWMTDCDVGADGCPPCVVIGVAEVEIEPDSSSVCGTVARISQRGPNYRAVKVLISTENCEKLKLAEGDSVTISRNDA